MLFVFIFYSLLIHLQSTHTVYGIFTIALIYSQSIGHLHLISFIIRFFSILFFLSTVVAQFPTTFIFPKRQSLVKGLWTAVRSLEKEKKFRKAEEIFNEAISMIFVSYPSQWHQIFVSFIERIMLVYSFIRILLSF